MGRERARPRRRLPRARLLLTLLEPRNLGVDEQVHELLERHLWLPAELRPRLRRVANEVVQLGAPPLQRLVDMDELAPVEVDPLEGKAYELLDRVQLARSDDVVVRLVAPEHQPHRAHVVAGVPPVALRAEVSEPDLAREPEPDRRSRGRDLARHELERPPRRLVVVEDPRRRVKAVAQPVRA